MTSTIGADISALQRRIQRANVILHTRQGQLASLTELREQSLTELEEHTRDIQSLGKIVLALQATASSLHEETVRSIEALITQGLQAITNSDIAFKIESVLRNKQVTLDFYVTTKSEHGEIKADPMDARGGGIAALCGLFMRAVVIKLLGTRVRPILILDEPLSHLSSEYVPAAAEMLQALAYELGIQIVMVSHHEGFIDAADTVYRIDAPNGTATVERLK